MAKVDIEKIKNRLLVKYPAFASAIVNARYQEASVETLCTDGKDIYYNPEFLSNQTFDEQLFSLAHEICHIRSNHIMRSKDKDMQLWNIATDAVINMLLVNDGLTMPEGLINYPDAINYSAEEYYEKLLKEREQEKSNGQNNDAQNSSSENNQQNQGTNTSSSLDNTSSQQDETQSSEQSAQSENDKQNSPTEDGMKNQKVNNPSNIDDHSMWQDAVQKSEQENAQSEDETQNYNDNNSNEQDLFDQNRKEKIENLKKLRDEIVKQSTKAGKNTNSQGFSLDSVGISKELIDWRRLLKKSINIKLKWDTKNPEVEYGVLTPKLKKLKFPRTEILLDTSGSINAEMLKSFLRECKYILQNSEMWVGCFDTKFYGFEQITSEKEIDDMHFIGRGGTNFDVAVQAFSQRADNKIIFTDGEAKMPKKKVNAIWVVFGDLKINPLGGKVIYIDKSQLKELHSTKGTIRR